MKLITAILTLTLALAAQTSSKGALDKSRLETFLRHLLLFRGPVSYQIGDAKPAQDKPGYLEVPVHINLTGNSRDDLYYVSQDGQTIVNKEGVVYNVNKNPFQANLDKLTTNELPSFGAANAPITIVEFGDLQCPDCKMEAPVLRKNVPQGFPGKVRVFFKDFPLESIHPWARTAAIAGRCVYHQNAQKFWDFYDWVYDNQEQINPDNLHTKVLAWAGQSGVDTIQLGRCMDTKATDAEVSRSIAEGKALGVPGTPTLFINGRRIGGLQWSDLQIVLNNELDYVNRKQ